MPDFSLSTMDAAEIAVGYMRHKDALRALLDGPSAQQDWETFDAQAYDYVYRVVAEGPLERAWEIVVAVLRAVSDDRLAAEAVNCLEPLVQQRGADLLDRIEQEARYNDRFRWALGQIWLDHGDMPPEPLRRIVAASGGAIRPL
jgi:hypothetical protein